VVVLAAFLVAVDPALAVSEEASVVFSAAVLEDLDPALVALEEVSVASSAVVPLVVPLVVLREVPAAVLTLAVSLVEMASFPAFPFLREVLVVFSVEELVLVLKVALISVVCSAAMANFPAFLSPPAELADSLVEVLAEISALVLADSLVERVPAA
jgi:hypothetical protein